MASTASTTPGSVATFRSCSSDPSSAIASISSASANTRPGTRMDPLAGSSHTTSAIRRSSDIEHHARAPAVPAPLEAEPVVRRSLDEMRWIAGPALDPCAEAVVHQRERSQAVGHEPARLTEKRELPEPVGEEGGAVAAGQGDRYLDPLSRLRRGHELAHGVEASLEDTALARGLELQLELSGVFDPAKRHWFPGGPRRAPGKGRTRKELMMPPRGIKKGTKRARQYERVKQSERQQGRSEGRAKEIAARTVQKERARRGESRTRSRTSTQDMSSGRRGGQRSGTSGPKGRTRDQLYNEAKKLRIEGRSRMNKQQLLRAVESKKS